MAETWVSQRSRKLRRHGHVGEFAHHSAASPSSVIGERLACSTSSRTRRMALSAMRSSFVEILEPLFAIRILRQGFGPQPQRVMGVRRSWAAAATMRMRLSMAAFNCSDSRLMVRAAARNSVVPRSSMRGSSPSGPTIGERILDQRQRAREAADRKYGDAGGATGDEGKPSEHLAEPIGRGQRLEGGHDEVAPVRQLHRHLKGCGALHLDHQHIVMKTETHQRRAHPARHGRVDGAGRGRRANGGAEWACGPAASAMVSGMVMRAAMASSIAWNRPGPMKKNDMDEARMTTSRIAPTSRMVTRTRSVVPGRPIPASPRRPL